MFTRRRKLSDFFDGVSIPERVGFALLLLLVVAAPIPHGGILPGATLRIQILSFLTAAIAFMSHRGPLRLPVVSLALMSGVAIVGALQLIPLPAEVLSRLSPASLEVYRNANEILRMFDRPAISARISVVPGETVRAALLIMSYVCAFIAGSLLTRTRMQRNVLVALILMNAVAHVIYASVVESDFPWRSGTFVNQNHFAGYLEIALAFAFAMLWLEIRRAGRREHGEEAADVLERRLVGAAVRLVAWVAIGAGIVLAQSRMGIAAPLVTTGIMLALALAHRRSGRRSIGRALYATAALIAGAALILFTTGRAPFLRFLILDPRDPASELRLRLWEISIDAWKRFPHFGSGLGTFREAFRAVQAEEVTFIVEQAHNDVLQLLVTGGWISVLLAAVSLAYFSVLLLRKWWRQSSSTDSAFALGAIGALISLLLHGLVEFNFSIPAIPLTLAVVLGAGWSAVSGDISRGGRR